MSLTVTSDLDAQLDRLTRLHPKLIDLSLGRVERLLAKLGNPHHRLPPVVHVAGTNGKGSTVAFLKAITEAAGYRVHVFTSPHLRRFNERIAIAKAGGAQSIDDAALADVLARTEAANGGDAITFFEITTAAAFLAFSERPADLVILETGLGGRLDATNVIARPLLTAITPVSFDHCEFLGNTIEAIAGEKAGIIKPERPVVVSRQREAALNVIRARAEALKAPVAALGAEWDVFEQQARLVYQDEAGLLDLPLPRLRGRHQIDNAGTAIAAARRLEGFAIPDAAFARGVQNATWPARLERLPVGRLHSFAPEGSDIWLDGGHNPAAGEAIAQALADLDDRAPTPIHLIVGMLARKDAKGFFRPFQGLSELTTTIAVPGQAQAYSATDLAQLARQAGVAASPAESLEGALERSNVYADGPVRILIAGSLYLAGHVLTANAG